MACEESQSLLLSEQSEYGGMSSIAESALETVEPSVLSWENLQVTVQKTGRELLKGVSGVTQPGQLMALMGASGAGKTTLLNTLLCRNLKGLDVQGRVLVNGNAIGSDITAISGYAQQEELFVGTLTVREYLTIQARLRVNGPKEKRLKRVNIVLKQLGLFKCQHTPIGVMGVKKGISGGEARRLTFACELLSNPPILFCDEPTTGLDSFMAESVVSVLSRLAHSGRTVICTIHQPASQLYAMFDSVMFLACGRTAFLGSPSQAIRFFENAGYPCPQNYNPADLIIHTLAIVPGEEVECNDRVEKIINTFEGGEHGAGLRRDVESVTLKALPAGRRQASWGAQFAALSRRAFLDNWRNPSLARAKIVQKTIMGLFVGLLYLQTKVKMPFGVDNINGALFYLVCELTYSTLFGILTFLPGDFPLVVREYHDGLYSVGAYYISRALSYVPLFTLDGVMMMTISYWMIGLNASISQFLLCIGISILIEQSASAFGVMLSTISPSYPVAVSLAGPLLTLLSLTGGLYANVGQLPAYISWIQYLSWFRYGFEALTINQWDRVDEPGVFWNATKQEETLEKLSFNSSMMGWDALAMAGFIGIFYLVGYLGLFLRVRRAR
ncbi:unnamed protein product, partial [Mesorhabditis spiculigera]